MKIPDNIISRKLKNVNFIIGGSCSGKQLRQNTLIDEISKLKIKPYYRNEKSTIKEMLNIIENHFGLK